MVDFRRIILGRRLASYETKHTKISNVIGLSVFSSDALSSVAYATQEIIMSLMKSTYCIPIYTSGIAANIISKADLLQLSVPIAIAVAILLCILAVSYQQTIMEYPGGGGAYTVAKANLGEIAAQTAGISLLIGYVLTVAVSVSSGIAAITAVFHDLHTYRTSLALLAIAFIAIMNLRGVRESGGLFAIPTYGFIFCIMTLLATGAIRWILEAYWHIPNFTNITNEQLVLMHNKNIVWTIMCAYAAGCTALTGVEAISNGVTVFQEPAGINAAKTMRYMVILLGVMFIGITTLSNHYGINDSGQAFDQETMLSQLTRKIINYNISDGNVSYLVRFYYYTIQSFTFAILIVAANTAYADFPRLAALHAQDMFLPKQLTSIGDRLVLSNGIVILSILAGILVICFDADTSKILPLYALGVFLGFTISQFGMVVHWYRKRNKYWQIKFFVNGIGGFASALVMLNTAITKFKDGAWVVIALVPTLVFILFSIHRHYIKVKSALAASRTDAFLSSKHHVVVLVSNLHAGVVQALAYARLIAGNRVEALTVDLGSNDFHESPHIQKLRADWAHYGMGIHLRIVPSPYRRIIEPILNEVDRIRLAEPEVCLTIILPEFDTAKWWQRIFHNQMAFRIKTKLMQKPGVIVISVRMHLTH